MKNRIVTGIVMASVAIVVATALVALSTGIEAAPPGSTSKKVQLTCKPGWAAGAVGQYGGVSFGLNCNNGRATAVIDGTSGTAYSIRMGVESSSGAFDCFFTGDAQNVNETCVEVRLTIR